MRALLDGDEFIYKACVSKVEEVNWDTGESESVLPTLRQAKRKLVDTVDYWVRTTEADQMVFVVSPPERGLFRRGLFPGYKSGRNEKPEIYSELEAWAIDRWDGKWYPGLEADDTMGVLAGKGTIIVSSDKDMKTVPGRLAIPKSGKFMTITQDRADHWWMMQTLMGDSTDGFAGCIGCGPKGAEEVLLNGTNMAEWWPEVERRFELPKTPKYRDFPQSAKDALTQAQLSRILRPNEYDPKGGGVFYRIGKHDISFNAHTLAR
ncbi:hypothetical protein QTI51_09530 [Variovorax sp. J22G73]|uniref:hypothetical protein n=1 Tax=unclassified Variovorax TaxID=663243 RepID=UPI002577B153|nr:MULTISPECIES: hypothetical protein [unclassified Variovorax]MDM0006460.1 hypothetical protein [Variovorax sp. J22R203]MDM0097517.1 hypothetical protein [Variovorax sp. J22G73]